MSTTDNLKPPSYSPARGGHAPGDVRDAFLAAIDAYEAWEESEPEPTIEVRERPMPISAVCGLVWNCSDTMPGLEHRQIEDLTPFSHFGADPAGRCGTYGRAARVLKALILAVRPATVAS